VTNGFPLGSSLLLPVDTANCVQTRKAKQAKQAKLVLKTRTTKESCGVCGDDRHVLDIALGVRDTGVVCDKCDDTYHLRCLKIKDVPTLDWFCPRCVEGIDKRLGRHGHRL
jgi:hypothetical protein